MAAPVTEGNRAQRLSGMVARAQELLTVLDREHTAAELYTNLHGVRHELQTAADLLPNGAQWGRTYRGGVAKGGRPHLVLQLLKQGAITSKGISTELSLDMTAVSCVMSRFCQSGLAEKVGKVKSEDDGRLVTLWRVTPKGVTVLDRLASEQLALLDA